MLTPTPAGVLAMGRGHDCVVKINVRVKFCFCELALKNRIYASMYFYHLFVLTPTPAGVLAIGRGHD